MTAPTFTQEIRTHLTEAGWDLTLPAERPTRTRLSMPELVILAAVGHPRTTVLSRFWTIPAHKNPIQRRLQGDK